MVCCSLERRRAHMYFPPNSFLWLHSKFLTCPLPRKSPCGSKFRVKSDSYPTHSFISILSWNVSELTSPSPHLWPLYQSMSLTRNNWDSAGVSCLWQGFPPDPKAMYLSNQYAPMFTIMESQIQQTGFLTEPFTQEIFTEYFLCAKKIEQWISQVQSLASWVMLIFF